MVQANRIPGLARDVNWPRQVPRPVGIPPAVHLPPTATSGSAQLPADQCVVRISLGNSEVSLDLGPAVQQLTAALQACPQLVAQAQQQQQAGGHASTVPELVLRHNLYLHHSSLNAFCVLWSILWKCTSLSWVSDSELQLCQDGHRQVFPSMLV